MSTKVGGMLSMCVSMHVSMLKLRTLSVHVTMVRLGMLSVHVQGRVKIEFSSQLELESEGCEGTKPVNLRALSQENYEIGYG